MLNSYVCLSVTRCHTHAAYYMARLFISFQAHQYKGSQSTYVTYEV
jgi:hypothetical protein